MKHIALVFFFACILMQAPSFAQPPDSLWSIGVGGLFDDVCYAVEQISDTQYVCAGMTQSRGAGGADLLLVLTNGKDGRKVRTRTFGSSGDDVCHAMFKSSDGCCILAGYTTSFGAGDRDFWILKVNVDGKPVWRYRTFGGAAGEKCWAASEAADGGYTFAGYTDSFGAGMRDGWLVKTSTKGDSIWSHAYGGTGSDGFFSLQTASDGGFILGGYSYSFGDGSRDFFAVKTDPQGVPAWMRSYGGPGEDVCLSVLQTTDGGFLLAGYTSSFGNGSFDFWILKTDENGDSLWSRTFGGNEPEYCWSAVEMSDGGFTLAGHTASYGAANRDLWIVRTNSSGNFLWHRAYGGSRADECYDILPQDDGGYLLGGTYTPDPSQGRNFYVLKIGYPQKSAEPIAGISILPEDYDLAVYPNPFNPTATLSFELENPGSALLQVFNMSGQSVATLADNRLTGGSHRFVFNGQDLPSGVYFAQLQTENRQQTQKLILLK